MDDQKTEWEITRIKERMADSDQDMSQVKRRLRVTEDLLITVKDRLDTYGQLEQRTRALEEYRIQSLENTKNMMKSIEKLQDSNVWVRRALAGGVLTSLIAAVSSMVQWAIQN